MQKLRVIIFSSPCDVYLLGLIRSLGEAGYRPDVYLAGEDYFPLASRYVGEKRLFNSEERCLQFLLHDYPVTDEKPFILTGSDRIAYLMDINYDALSQKFILPSAGGQGRIVHWMDKDRQNELAERHGLSVPWRLVIDPKDGLPADITYPVFTKSIKSAAGGKDEEGVFYNAAELRQKLDGCVSDRVVVMRYVQKRNELNFFGLAVKGHVYLDYCSEINRFPERFWWYGYYEHFFRARHDDLYHRIVAMIRETNYEGPFEVEFLVEADETPYFMEINLRIDGDTYKVCEGVNLPAEWCRLATLPESELPENLPLKRSDFYGMTETKDFKYSVRTGKIGFWKWLRQFLSCNRLMLFNLRDPAPVWAYFKERRTARKSLEGS